MAGTASKFITFNTFGGLLAFKGAAPNGNDGLLVTSTGGHIAARTNVFSGNTGNGIEVGGHAHGVTIDPNIVGLTTKGDTVLPNGGDGVLLDDSGAPQHDRRPPAVGDPAEHVLRQRRLRAGNHRLRRTATACSGR